MGPQIHVVVQFRDVRVYVHVHIMHVIYQSVSRVILFIILFTVGGVLGGIAAMIVIIRLLFLSVIIAIIVCGKYTRIFVHVHVYTCVILHTCMYVVSLFCNRVHILAYLGWKYGRNHGNAGGQGGAHNGTDDGAGPGEGTVGGGHSNMEVCILCV